MNDKHGVPMLRRMCMAVLLCCPPSGVSADESRVTVIYSSEGVAYTQALDGLRTAIGNVSLLTVDLSAPNAPARLANALENGGNQLVVTIGSDALGAVRAHKIEAPLVATMIMHSEQSGPNAAYVHLDISVADILSELKVMFPDKMRIAVIRNPTQPKQVDLATITRARQQGFTIQVVDSTNPAELLQNFHLLKGRADFVLCLPDSTLYNGTTAKPLILASLNNRLPIVGFSASFVRAGAAVGVYPDFRDVGVQTGEIAQKGLAGHTFMADEGPRKITVAVNQRVVRLLGLEYQPRRGELVTFR